MKLKLSSIFFIPERKWSLTVFILLIFCYLIFNLIIALPKGADTSLVSYNVPNPKCSKASEIKGINRPCNPILQITPKSTAMEYIRFFGPGDPASYASGGLALAGKEWGSTYHTAPLSLIKRLQLMNLIGYGMWPPGMYLLNSLPLMMNSDFPLGFYQVLMASLLWAVAFALIVSFLILRMRLWMVFIVPVFLMSFPLFHNYLMRYGALYSETYGAALMTIGFSLLTFFYYRKPYKRLMFLGGICFAIACFMRSQMFPVAVGVSILLGVFSFIGNKDNHINKLKEATIIFLLAFYIPIGGYIAFNNGGLFHVEFAWEVPFTIPDFPNAGAGNFLVQGGMRAACIVDGVKCKQIQQQIKKGTILPHANLEVLKSFLFHPINFSEYKLPIAWRYWMGNPGSQEYRLDSVIFLFILFFSLAFMVFRKHWLFLGFTLVTIAFVFGPPFLLHFEVRYFYILNVFLLFLPLWLLFISSKETT